MENFEKAYFVAKETEYWDNLCKASVEFGTTHQYTDLIRAKWAVYYDICKHFFHEYRTMQTLDG